MKNKLNSEVALVTGGWRGVGAAIVKRLFEDVFGSRSPIAGIGDYSASKAAVAA